MNHAKNMVQQKDVYWCNHKRDSMFIAAMVLIVLPCGYPQKIKCNIPSKGGKRNDSYQ
jgi:hypothetical protein